MGSIKRDLLHHAEFLKSSGYLYLENEVAVSASETEDELSRNEPAKPISPPATQAAPNPRAENAPLGPALSAGERDLSAAEARQRIAACTACELCRTRTQTVYGDGSLMAKVVFVGEAPGAEEDNTGIPFVGRAGQLLNKMIEAIGMKREEVFICNTVKCRPPGNRDPLPSEKQACQPFLFEQLELIRPQIIVGLGAHAGTYLTGIEGSLGSLRGKWHVYRGIPVMATYHPAFLLRSPGMKKQAWEDMQMLIKRYHELNPGEARQVWRPKS